MQIKNNLKIRKLKHSVKSFALFHMLQRNKRAVSAVISNLILIAAVIAVGFAAIFYTQSTSNTYQEQYGQSMDLQISKVKQTLSFEYVSYTAPNLYVYIINSGIMSANITDVSVGNLSPTFNLYLMKNGQVSQEIQNNTLSFGQEGCTISNMNLNPGTSYTVKVTTKEGSAYVYNFMP